MPKYCGRLGDAWADTTTPHGRLMLTVLGGLAEFERHLILARTSEGRKRAQARGVRFGRKPRLTPHQRQEALARRAAGEACTAIARSYAVSHLQRAKDEATRATAEAERAKADAKAARELEETAKGKLADADAARVAAEGREQACQSTAKKESGFGARFRSWFKPKPPDTKNP